MYVLEAAVQVTVPRVYLVRYNTADERYQCTYRLSDLYLELITRSEMSVCFVVGVCNLLQNIFIPVLAILRRSSQLNNNIN